MICFRGITVENMENIMKRFEFIKRYSNLRPSERTRVCCRINHSGIENNPFSWNIVYFEVKANTKLSKKLLEAVEDE